MRSRVGKTTPAQGGMTLIELLIVIVIIGILAAVGYPNYSKYVIKSNRQEAKAALTKLAGRQEQYFLSYKTYTTDLLGVGSPTENNLYTLAVAAGTCTAGIARCYTLTASPVVGSKQAEDAECRCFTLNQAGTKGVASCAAPLPTTAPTKSAAECW